MTTRSRTLAGVLAALLLGTSVARPAPAVAQGAGLPTERDARISVTCANASGSIDAHIHLVGGRGRPPRYLQLPALACDSASVQQAEAMTIWWQGSIWHVAITAESEGVRVVCETEGLQLPAQVTCPVAAGEVTFAMDLGVDGQPGAGPPDVKVAAPLTP